MVGKNEINCNVDLPISEKMECWVGSLDTCDGRSFKLPKLKMWMQNYFSGISASANRRSTSGSADGRYLIKKKLEMKGAAVKASSGGKNESVRGKNSRT